jgi:parallel beta helix pectate lyase-like protein/dockerin type I repeat protein
MNRVRVCVPTVLLALVVTVTVAHGATYYVDYDAGTDTSAGTTPGTALKHCPGDNAAGGTAGSTSLAAGDTVIFKGGVHYRGSFDADWSGTAAQPIVYDGNTAGAFGTGRAIIDGAEPLTGWVQCQSAAECGDNPNWPNIYWTTAPAGLNPGTTNLYENNQMCWMAQDPNQSDPFFMDEIDQFYSVPVGAMTTTSVTDGARLNQSDANHWDGSYVMLWVTPNVVRYRKILSFNPATDTITYDATGAPYDDRDGRYSIYNSLHLLDTPGEYFFNDTPEPDGRHKVYLWPQTPGDINAKEITVSVRTIGVDLGGVNYVTVEGFRIQKQSGSSLHDGIGVKALDWNLSPAGLVIRNNEIFGIRHHPERGYGAVYIYGGQNCVIEENSVWEMPVNMGFLLGGNGTIVRNNVLRKCGAQTIWFMGATNGQIIGNEVTDSRGTHANGISVYQNSSNVLVFGNKILDSNISITVQASADVTLAYNICVTGAGYAIADWSGCTNLKIHNNTTIRTDNYPAITGSSGGEIRNNIGLNYASSGSLTPDSGGNIFCLVSQLDSLFVDWTGRDFHLKPGSAAIDAGLVLGYTEDFDGTVVPQGAIPDIGALEFLQGTVITGWSVLGLHGGNPVAVVAGENYVEPRAEGMKHLQIAFSSPLDAATVNAATVTISGQTSGDQSSLIDTVTLVGGNTLDVVLTGALPNADWYTVAVSDTLRTSTGDPIVGDRDRRIGALLGDVDGSAAVASGDIVAVRAAAGQAVSAATARYDIDGSGAITGLDLLRVRSSDGEQLP